MNTEWITDRLPTLEDSLHYDVMVWDERIGPIVWSYDAVNEGQPWQPIPKPEPYYVKPKRWAVTLMREDEWCLYDTKRPAYTYYFPHVATNLDAVQRICDIYNEVLP